MKRKNLIVDGNNLLLASIATTEYKHKQNTYMRRDVVDGIDRNSLHKFMSNLSYLVRDNTPTDNDTEMHVYVCWDMRLKPDSENWRKSVYPQYKANRDPNDPNRKALMEIATSLVVPIKKLFSVLGVHYIQPFTSEADDLIFYLKNELDGDNVVVSADQDMYQCVDERTVVYNFHSKVRDFITLDNWGEYVPVDKEFYPHYKAIMGDTSDNISGLYRYGEVKTKALIENWDNRHEKLNEEQLEEIEAGLAIVDLAYKPLHKNETKLVWKQIERTNEIKGLSSKMDLLTVLSQYGLTDMKNTIMDNMEVYINNKIATKNETT